MSVGRVQDREGLAPVTLTAEEPVAQLVLHLEAAADTFGEYDQTHDDYDDCGACQPIEYKLTSADGAVIVVGQFSGTIEGSWRIGIANADWPEGGGSNDSECMPIPDWAMRFKQSEQEYSPALEIEVPDDTKLTCLTRLAKEQA